MVTRAIESARKQGIDLVLGTLNAADGNCAFDAVLNNINDRQCFVEKLSLSSRVYRQIWVTELEMESINYPSLGAGFTTEEKVENWNHLKQSGVYDIDFFGDFVMHAIAKGCNKNILIINTSEEAADPIYVIKAEQYGGIIDPDIPVVVGYNQVHYESLHPATKTDIEKTKILVNTYISGNYQYQKRDIPYLISSTSEQKKKAKHEILSYKENLIKSHATPSVWKNESLYSENFPPLPTRKSRAPKKILLKGSSPSLNTNPSSPPNKKKIRFLNTSLPREMDPQKLSRN